MPESANPNAENGDSQAPLSHIARGADGNSHAQMVDVGAKENTSRSALARAQVRFPGDLLQRVLAGEGPKGPILEVSRVAGILAAKRTADLIPMCHPLALHHVDLEFLEQGGGLLEIRCRASVQGPTGVEMEALLGASLAALTVYDMCKAAAKGISIERVELLEKSGGRSGTWRREGFFGSTGA